MRLRQCLIFLFCLKLNKLDVFFCSVYLSNTQCVYLSLQVWRFVFCSVYLSNTQSVNLSLQVWRFQSCCNLTFLLLVFVNSRIAHICHPCFKQHFTPLFLINNKFRCWCWYYFWGNHFTESFDWWQLCSKISIIVWPRGSKLIHICL